MIFLNKILDYTPGRKGAIHDGKYLCSQCGRTYVYDTELGDIAKKHRMQLRSEVDDVITAESSEPMIVNFADQYYTITCFSLYYYYLTCSLSIAVTITISILSYIFYYLGIT